MRAVVTAGGLFLATALAVGCGGGGDKKGGGDGVQGAPTTGPGVNQVGKRPPTPQSVELTDAKLADLDKRVADDKGQVVHVEFWSLATEPPPDLPTTDRPSGPGKGAESKPDAKAKVARHGMPRADGMMGRYGGYGLTIIGVNTDPPEKRAEVLKYLQDKDARFVVHYFWTDATPEAKAKLAEKYKFAGTPPHQVLIGRDGGRVWATGEPLPDRVIQGQQIKTGNLDELTFAELDKK